MIAWLWRALFGGSVAPAEARAQFEAQRGRLREEFLRAAQATGKPRGLVWTGLEWEPGFELARDRASGEVAGLAGVTISFEAVAGGEMEGVEAVGNLRSASALFVLREGQWLATGKAFFNLDPPEVLARFAGQWERLEAAVGG